MFSERSVLLVLASAMFTHIMDFMIIMPLGSQLIRAFEITPAQFSFVVSSYSFSAFISALISSYFIDRFDRKKSFLLCYAGFTLGTLFCGLAPTYEILMVSRAVTGFFGGVVGAIILSIVSDLVPLARRASAIGLVMAAFSVASVFGVPFGLYISSIFSWHAPFLFLAAISLIAFIATAIILPPVKGHLSKALMTSPWESMKKLITKRNPLYGLLFTGVLMLGHFTIIPFIAPYMVGNVGFTELELTYIYLIGGGLTIFTSPLVGKLADRIGRVKVFIIFGLLVIIPVYWITNMGESPIWLALIATGLFFVFANGRMVPSTTMVTSIIKPENRGSFMNLRTSVQQLFSGLSAIIGGLIVTEIPSTVSEGSVALENYEVAGYFTIAFTLITVYVGTKLRAVEGSN